jgi:hypothetical protein
MRIDASGGIVGHTDMEGAIAYAGEDADVALMHPKGLKVWMGRSSRPMERRAEARNLRSDPLPYRRPEHDGLPVPPTGMDATPLASPFDGLRVRQTA